MAKQLIRAVVQLPRVSGLPEDDVLNVFHFVNPTAADPDPTDVLAINNSIIGFYNNVQPSFSLTVASFLAQAMSRVSGAARVDYYTKEIDPDGGDFGSPISTSSWTLGAIASGPPTGMAGETAIVMSFHGDLTDVPETANNPTPPPAFFRPASRRRGRSYIGPISTAGITESAGGDFEVLPSSQLRQTVRDGGLDLRDHAYTGGWEWCVYSPTDDDAYQVVNGFVDNAFDTQRRRGNAATGRITFD